MPAVAALVSLALAACALPYPEREGVAAGSDALHGLALASQDVELAFAGFDTTTVDTELARGAVHLRAPALPVSYTGKYAMTPGRVPHPSLLGPDSLLAREERSQKVEAAMEVPAWPQTLGASYETHTLIERTSRLALPPGEDKGRFGLHKIQSGSACIGIRSVHRWIRRHVRGHLLWRCPLSRNRMARSALVGISPSSVAITRHHRS